MSAESLREIFRNLEGRFQRGTLDRELVYYLTLGDGPAEKWTLRLGPMACVIQEGKHIERADCVVKTTSALFLRMVDDGYVPGAIDFMTGKIKSNDPFLLQHLQRAFDL